MTFPRLSTFMTSLLFCGLLFGSEPASAQPSNDASRSERKERLRNLKQSFKSMETQAANADTEESVYVNATSGRDTDSCGTQTKPCLTITQGLNRAREIQTESRTNDIKFINIEIAAGTYAESVAVKLNWIRLRGAGAGVSMIQSPGGPAVIVSSAQAVLFEGLTMSSLNSTGLGAANHSFIGVSGCEFRDSRTGIVLFTESSAEVTSSTFSNNSNGVVAINSSTALLFNSVITGQSTNQGSGVTIGDGGMGELQNVSISQTRTGVAVWPNATLFTFGGLNISNNRVGCFVAGSSYLELSGSTVSNNSSVGVLLDLGSSAGIFSMILNNNGTAISVNGNSYVDIGNSEVKFNTLGIGFDLFGKGVLRQVDVSNNASNTQMSRGGEFFSEP